MEQPIAPHRRSEKPTDRNPPGSVRTIVALASIPICVDFPNQQVRASGAANSSTLSV